MDQTRVPLKVKQPAGVFPCRWELSDDAGRSYRPHGQLDLLAGRHPSGKVAGEVPSDGSGGFPERFRYDRLAGELLSGAGFMLIDAVLEVWSPPGIPLISFPEGNASVVAQMGLVGHGVQNLRSTKVTSVRTQVTGLDRVIEAAPITQVSFPSDLSSGSEMTYSVKTGSDLGPRWHNERIGELKVIFAGSATVFANYQFGVRFTPLVQIDLAQPMEVLDVMSKLVMPLVRVVSVVTGRHEEVTFLEVTPESSNGDEFGYRQVFSRQVSQQPYEPEPGKLPTAERAALRCAQGGVSLLDLVDGWRQLAEDQNPLVHTYDPNALGSDQHPRARFLLLVQALEGLSNWEKRLENQNIAYRKKKDRVVAACMDFLTGANRRFVKKNFKDSGVHLADRLRDMFETLPIDPSPYLDGLAIIHRVKSENESIDTVVAAIAKIRNDLAHGNRTYPVTELLDLANALEVVVRMHALRVLGVDEEVQRNALKTLLRDRC